jgi:hypothetical protein
MPTNSQNPEVGPETSAADEELFARLRSYAAATDAIPADLVRSASEIFGLRNIDAELAALVHDSAHDDDLVLVRGEEEVRTLTFEKQPDVIVHVQLTPTGSTLSLLAMVDGADEGSTIELERRDGRAIYALDAAGRLLLSGVRAGALRLRITGRDGSLVATSWVMV